jgi:hypothetical protein
MEQIAYLKTFLSVLQTAVTITYIRLRYAQLYTSLDTTTSGMIKTHGLLGTGL